MLAAMAYKRDSEDMLTLLAGDGVSIITRICAAFFGVAIIGAGVPVFCVIIKNTLYSTKACSAHTSFFWGAVFPYVAAWTLYQGDALMKVLNWAGLVINGSVAFILPLILCSYFYYNKNRHQPDFHDVEMSHSRIPKHLDENEDENETKNENKNNTEIGTENDNGNNHDELKESDLINNSDSTVLIEKSLPDFLMPYRWWIIHSIIVLFSVMITLTIIMDIITGSGP